jgi:hypothetical protein
MQLRSESSLSERVQQSGGTAWMFGRGWRKEILVYASPLSEDSYPFTLSTLQCSHLLTRHDCQARYASSSPSLE